jgi:predicted DNA-binding transcriptional regulator AlpA
LSLEHSPTRADIGHDDDPLVGLELQRILSVKQWCALLGISLATGKRILRSGNGPKVVRISAKRIGIRLADHLRWLEARTR